MQKILEKRERKLGVKLSIKGERCNGPKCALIRKPAGMVRGKRMSKITEFGGQLREKQKLRFSYGLTDKQLKDIFQYASAQAEETPKVIMAELESRLDNIVYRLGFTAARSTSRKMVSHGHFTVNGRKVTIPSFKVTPGDVIGVRPESKDQLHFQNLKEKVKEYVVPGWLKMDIEKMEGKVVEYPHDVDAPFDIGLVVDYYLR